MTDPHNQCQPGSASDKFERTYAVEIVFDTPISFAEQDRLACVVLGKRLTYKALIA